MIGWSLAFLVRSPDRPTRLWCLLAAVVADLDSLGLIFGWDVYERYHHVLLHNLPFGLLVTAIGARWIGLRPRPLALVFAALVSHLVGDYFGSGAGWGIMPFLPFADLEFVYTMTSRDVLVPGIVGNVGAAGLLVLIAARAGRTPIEFVHGDADRFLVSAIRLGLRRTSCAKCSGRATFRCVGCQAPICDGHAGRRFTIRPRCGGCPA